MLPTAYTIVLRGVTNVPLQDAGISVLNIDFGMEFDTILINKETSRHMYDFDICMPGIHRSFRFSICIKNTRSARGWRAKHFPYFDVSKLRYFDTISNTNWYAEISLAWLKVAAKNPCIACHRRIYGRRVAGGCGQCFFVVDWAAHLTVEEEPKTSTIVGNSVCVSSRR